MKQNSKLFLSLLAFLTISFGFSVYYNVYNLEVWQALFYSFGLFVLEVKQPNDFGLNDIHSREFWHLIYVPAFMGLITTFTSILGFALQLLEEFSVEWARKQKVKKILKGKHSVIFGLGEFSSAFLHNEIQRKDFSYIIFEKNPQDEDIELFRKAGIPVIITNVFDEGQLDVLDFSNMEHAIITLGNDRDNINLANHLSIELERQQLSKTSLKIHVHIVNSDLDLFFHEDMISQQQSTTHRIDIKSFSFYEQCAGVFFEHNFIDGNSNQIIQSQDDFHIAIVGNGELAINIAYQAANIAHLPNQNKLHIHLVDGQASSLKNMLVKRYPGIEKFTCLDAINVSDETLDFFKQDSLWKQKNLTHVFIAYDDEFYNINIATNLLNKTYLSEAIDDSLKTQINIAVFNVDSMGKQINDDQNTFKQFYCFCDEKTICSRENFFKERHELIGKIIHYGYAELYNPNELIDIDSNQTYNQLNDKWYDSSKYTDKLSSKSQAKHIDIKLKSLGLKRIDSNLSPHDLLERNRKVFNSKIQKDMESLSLSDAKLLNYSKELPKLWDKKLKSEQGINVSYFPVAYDCMLEKLIRMEHNRWMAFHYLNGWEYDAIKCKPKKKHDCLMSLIEFDTPEKMLTVVYDIYAIMYIPNYLASAKYQITSLSEPT